MLNDCPLRSEISRDFDDGPAILAADQLARELISLDICSPETINGLLRIAHEK